jgi:hypothetical protein
MSQESETRQEDEQEEQHDEQEGQETSGEGDADQELWEKDPDELTTSEKAQKEEKEREAAAEEIKELEDDPPTDLSEWPSGKAKYETFGGAEGDHSYDEGPEQNLGPSSLRRHEDGNVSIAGEEVDDPDSHKADPIPGGPTDPNAQNLGVDGGDDQDEDDDASEDDG